MKTYWKLTIGGSALMLLLLATSFPRWWAAAGVATVLLSGYVGVKLAPYARALQERVPTYVVSVLGGVLQGLGLYTQTGAVWSLGLMLSLVLWQAGVAQALMARDVLRRRIKVHAN